MFPSNAISLQEVSPRYDDAKGTIHLDVSDERGDTGLRACDEAHRLLTGLGLIAQGVRSGGHHQHRQPGRIVPFLVVQS